MRHYPQVREIIVKYVEWNAYVYLDGGNGNIVQLTILQFIVGELLNLRYFQIQK